jgi:hypothetical protein
LTPADSWQKPHEHENGISKKMTHNNKQTDLMRKTAILLLLSLFANNIHAQKIQCDNQQIMDAGNLAINTVEINIRRGILAAGGDYGGEWTRDIAINSWNAVSLLYPQVAEKSLWSVTHHKDTIAHQYWDKILWTVSAINHYYITGDLEFLTQAYRCSENTIHQLEELAYDKEYGLFKGPAVFADGIAGYPEPVFDKNNFSSYVLDHHAANIKCLSTNCLYYGAYNALADMASILEKDSQTIESFKLKGEQLKTSILKHFYKDTEHKLNYMIDEAGKVHTYQEAMGYSFAVIFGVFTQELSYELTRNTFISKFGIPCLYPDFPRYSEAQPGRHNNIIWPMANGFFAKACIIADNYPAFDKELKSLTSLALDADKGNYEFWEIYNPYTGKPDGGYQAMGEDKPNHHWNSCRLQTWSATAYLNMLIHGVAGIRFTKNGLSFSPNVPGELHYLKLCDLTYRNAGLTIEIKGTGRKIKSFRVNGRIQEQPFIPAETIGYTEICIEME